MLSRGRCASHSHGSLETCWPCSGAGTARDSEIPGSSVPVQVVREKFRSTYERMANSQILTAGVQWTARRS